MWLLIDIIFTIIKVFIYIKDIIIKITEVIDRNLFVKFNVFDDLLLFAIGGYDSFGNQVISDFLPIKDNNDFIS